MVSSGGGGSSRDPNYATPSGTISQYGQSSSFSPSYNNVLSNGMGWADVSEVDAANNANANANAAAQQQAASTSGSSSSGTGSTDAFAQALMDYRKKQRMSSYMLGLDPRSAGQYFQTMQEAPVASTPTEQLMASMYSGGGGGGGRNQLAALMGGGGHGGGGSNRGGYGSSRS